MKKSDYLKLLQGARLPAKMCEKVTVGSVTDPTYAQSGRDLVFNPLPYEVKPIYSNGVPLKEMQAFDGMYKDKLDVFQFAKDYDAEQHKNAKDWKEKQDKNETPDSNNTDPATH